MSQNKDRSCVTSNFNEKIIFVIDTVQETTNVKPYPAKSSGHSSLSIITRAIEIFFHNKLTINDKHEFAVMSLDSQKAYWLCNFTGDVKTLLSTLESIEVTSNNTNEKYFDFQSFFKLIHEKVTTCSSLMQNNVVRIILTYCRSFMTPQFNIAETYLQELLKHDNFFIDVLYIHDSHSSSENDCEQILAELRKLSTKNVSYALEISTNAVEIHNYMAKLLAHPLQRIVSNNVKSCLQT